MQTFEAAAFHPQFPDGRETGTLTILPTAVRFAGGGTEVDLPMRGLVLKEGGASDRLFFFSHPDRPEWSVYTTDASVLLSPDLQAQPAIALQIESVRRRQRKGRILIAGVLLGIVLLLAGLYRLKDPLAGVIARRIPAKIEKGIGGTVMRQVLLTTPTVSNDEVLKPLKGLVAEISRGNRDRSYDFELSVARDSAINAYALPGGYLVINSGLILAAKTPEEVAGVLAHEMAHVTRQHSMKQIISSIGLFAILQAFVGDVSGVIAVVASNGSQLLEMKFSRDAERDADRAGVGYLLQSNIDPRGMVSFFRRLQEEEKTTGAAAEALAFIGTHPPTAERIADLEKTLARSRTGGFTPLKMDLEAVKRALQSESK